MIGCRGGFYKRTTKGAKCLCGMDGNGVIAFNFNISYFMSIIGRAYVCGAFLD